MVKLSQKKEWISLLAFLAVAVLWELVSRVSGHYSRNQLFPPFSAVLVRIFSLLQTRTFYTDLFYSMSRVLVGFIAGGVLGIWAGIQTARHFLPDALFSPLLNVLRPLPPIALVPIILIWFGLNEYAKYILVAIGAFFPVWISTHTAIRNINVNYLKTARCLQVRKRQVLFKVVLPAAMPGILSGLRTSLGVSFFCLVAAEMSGARAGLFFRINLAYTFFNMDEMVAGLILLGLVSLCTDRLFLFLAQKLFPWIKLR
jgi:NitT/TauT family transport system permease protein